MRVEVTAGEPYATGPDLVAGATGYGVRMLVELATRLSAAAPA
jgi:hypothetical protein